MRIQISLVLSVLILGGCVTNDPRGPIEVIAIDAPRFCERPVRSYSDFAYIRPTNEMVLSNDCEDLGGGLDSSDPAIWAVIAEEEMKPKATGASRLTLEHEFKSGKTAITGKRDSLDRLLSLAKANPQQVIMITGHRESKESAAIAGKRAIALREWLIKKGIPPERIHFSPDGAGGKKAEATIAVGGKE